MSFQARCPQCKKTVTTVTVLGDAELDRALREDGEVEVVCFQYDHRWKLTQQDKTNLRKYRAENPRKKSSH